MKQFKSNIRYFKNLTGCIIFACCQVFSSAKLFSQKQGSPIVPYVGMADPHIFSYNNKAYLYDTRDIDSTQTKTKFVMPDWHIWSSDDLIHWKHERTIDPTETYMGKSTECWATDMGTRNGKYYFYFSQGNRTTGVMVSDRPEGPFKDALGKPMLTEDLTSSREYDPTILTDDDKNKTPYIIFGHHRDFDPTLGYFIAEMNDDMVSLKTKPVKIQLTGNSEVLSGNDKPNIHKYNGTYYLSAGSHYATSKNIYGPYEKRGNSGNEVSAQGNYGLTAQAHGNYFQWKNQWFHTWCKFHLTKEVARYRESYITYLHYKKNGEMVTDTVLLNKHFSNGVGQYHAYWDKIEAEWYMASQNTVKSDHNTGFEISETYNQGFLFYPNIRGMEANSTISLYAKPMNKGTIEVRENGINGPLLGSFVFNGASSNYQDINIQLKNTAGDKNLYFVFKGKNKKNIVAIDWFKFQNPVQTKMSISGNQFYINGSPTYAGRTWNNQLIEGLLMNSRMVQGVFDDLNPDNVNEFAYSDTKVWDAQRNNDEFMKGMEEWKAFGLNSFTLNLQGGSPYGYGNKKAYNPGFNPDGSLNEAYMQRAKKIIEKADQLEMVVILGLFYFGQDQHLKDEAAVKNAVTNVINWLHKQKYRNVIIEIANESAPKIGYDHEIIKPHRIHELISLAKSIKSNGYAYPVTTSFIGKGVPTKNVVDVSDFILIHGNGAKEPKQLQLLIDSTKMVLDGRNIPIVINEDDHYDFDKKENNFTTAIKNYVSWGFFDFRRKGEGFKEGFQSMPADWGVNSKRKMEFFNLVAEMTGSSKRKYPTVTKNDYFILETESTKSPLGNWKRINKGDLNYVEGASGDSYLEFQGNNPDTGPADSPLSYSFTAPEDGNYRLLMMASKRLEGARGDLCNDAYVKMEGNFTSACNLKDEQLREYIKYFQEGSTKTPEKEWHWGIRSELGKHEFYELIYNFKKGETYVLTLAGRSQRFSVDYMVLFNSTNMITKELIHYLKNIQNGQ